MDKPKESPTLKQAHLQAAASPRSNQSLQKSLLCHLREKNKKISHASQKLNLPTHNLTLKSIDNQTNIDEGQRTTAYNTWYSACRQRLESFAQFHTLAFQIKRNYKMTGYGGTTPYQLTLWASL